MLSSLGATKLTAMAELKKAYTELRNRLGKAPQRLDFARFDTPNPTVFLARGDASYWHFLQRVKEEEAQELSQAEEAYISFLDRELLNGKRPQELLLLKELLSQQELSVESYRRLLEVYGAKADQQTVDSVLRILSLDFFTEPEKARYGGQGLVSQREQKLLIGEDFFHCYQENSYFRGQVDDSIEAGLYLNQHYYDRSGNLKIGMRYSRKDVCRLLNWGNNQEGVVNGYKVDADTATCPIFVTYHKADDINDSVKYQDRLLDEATMLWFTKHSRTTESKTEKAIIEGNYRLDIFVKKDDSEGIDFLYLGKSKRPEDAENTKIPTAKGEKNIVSMRLPLEQPLAPDVYKHLTYSGKTSA